LWRVADEAFGFHFKVRECLLMLVAATGMFIAVAAL